MTTFINRDDFSATTSKFEPHGFLVYFPQHIFTILKEDGRATVVLPDNVLLESGAGFMPSREAASLEATLEQFAAIEEDLKE